MAATSTETISECNEKLNEWNGHSNFITSLACLSNDLVLSGSLDGIIKCWRINEQNGSAECLLTFDSDDGVYALTALPDNLVLSGDSDGIIKCWRIDIMGGSVEYLSTWKKDMSLEQKYNIRRPLTLEQNISYSKRIPITSLAVLENGWILSGSDVVRYWKLDEINIGGADCIKILENRRETNISALIALPNMEFLIGYEDGKIEHWKITNLEDAFTVQIGTTCNAHSGYIRGFNILGSLLTSFGRDRLLKRYSIGNGVNAICTFIEKENFNLNSFIELPNKLVLTTEFETGTIVCWKSWRELIKGQFIRQRYDEKFKIQNLQPIPVSTEDDIYDSITLPQGQTSSNSSQSLSPSSSPGVIQQSANRFAFQPVPLSSQDDSGDENSVKLPSHKK